MSSVIEIDGSRLTMDTVVEISQGINEGKGEQSTNKLSKREFHNLSEYAEWRIRGRLGIYPIDHSVSQYAQQALEKVGGPVDQEKPKITIYKGDPNAFVFPNGSIYLSDQLLQLVNTEEELLFVLMHERTHHLDAHSEKVLERAEDPEKTFKDIMLGGLGQSRVHEWEGDLRAFTGLDKLGINPMGGIDLLEKFRRDPKLAGGLIHGKSTDRALNLRAMTYAKDLSSIEKPLHNIPVYIRDAVKQEQSEDHFSSAYDALMKQVDVGSYFKSVEIIGKMNLNQRLLALETIMTGYEENKRKVANQDRAAFYLQLQESLIPVLSKSIWEDLAGQASINGQLPTDQQTTFLFYSVLNLTIGIEPKIHEKKSVFFNNNQSVTVKDPKTGLNIPWEANRFSLESQLTTVEDVTEYLKTLDPSIFTQLGLKLRNNPSYLAQTITQLAMDNFVFEDNGLKLDDFMTYIDKTTTELAALYSEHGGVKFSAVDVYEKIVYVAKQNLEQADVAALSQRVEQERPVTFNTIKEAEREKKAEEREYSDRLISLFKKFAVDVEETIENKKAGESGSPFLPFADRRDITHLDDEGKYFEELKQIFEERNIQTPQELLILLANFRKMIQEDQELWGLHVVTDNDWNPLMEVLVSESEVVKSITDPLARKLFDLKVSVLLAHDWASNNLLEPFDKYIDFFRDNNFNLDLYREFYTVATQDNKLAKETGVDVPTFSLLGPGQNEGEWSELLKEGKYQLLLRSLEGSSKAEFSKLLEQLTNEFTFDHYGNEGSDGYDSDVSDIKRRFLRDVFAKYDFDLTATDDLKSLYYLSTYLEDQTLAIRLQSIAWTELSKRFTFEDGFGFLEKELNANRLLSLKVVTDFIELNARTHEEIELATDKLIGLATKDSSLAAIGRLVVGEELVTKFFLDNKYDLLLACIGNGENDNYLKRYLYKKWVASMDYDRVETLDKVHLNDLMHKLYRLDAQSKYVLIRDLLTGDKGVLTDPDVNKRLQFVDFFLDNYIEIHGEEDAKFFRVIKDVMRQLVKTANYDLLYFAISPILQERMLIQPPGQLSWLDIIKTEQPPSGYQDLDDQSLYDSDEEDYDEILLAPPDGDTLEERRRYRESAREAWRSNIEDRKERYNEQYKQRVGEEDVDTLFKYINGSSEEQQHTREPNELRRQYEDVINVLVAAVEQRPEKQKMTVNEFILETAQKLGAPGVRFLQLIGQYVELPPHLEQSFNQVYDKVGGQSKITADQTLLREWPEARNRLLGLRERLGGGSLMSVFRTSDVDGKDLAVKILNPNSGHHTETTHKLLTEVFTILSEEDARFAPSITLLADIREWIRNDIDFEGFLEQDKQFRRKHDGYSIGGRHQIKIPVTYPPENKFFAQEDYVEGTNLTDVDRLRQQGHDVREVISLVTRNFLEQVKDGQVHSDIHPGNIRITPEGNVVFLDRNYYLQFGLRDKLFLRSLQGSLNNTTRATELCLDYIQSQGTQVESDKRQRIIEQARLLTEVTDPTDRLMRLSVILRKEDLRFPIKTTLLIKDLFYLDRMAKRVGFSGIAEAVSVKFS